MGTKFERARDCAHSIGDAIRRIVGVDAYRPERHYMRGPGPKTLARLGEELRARTDGITREPLPAEWVTVLRKIDRRTRKRADLADVSHHVGR